MTLFASFFLFYSLVTTQAFADPAAFLGMNYSFDGNFGFTAKVLSEQKEHKAIVGLGVSYYPIVRKFGVDISSGSTFDDSAVMIGYDFLQNSFIMSGGWANTENPTNPSTPSLTEPETPDSGDSTSSGGLSLGGSFPS